MTDIEEETAKLLQELDIKKLKSQAKQTNILLQQLLHKLMLTYTVDITKQVKLKQAEASSTYPSDLISSLKVIADLYFKMKEQNKYIEIKDDKEFKGNYIF